MGRAGGLIIGGPGIIGMWPPIGGLIPGAAGKTKKRKKDSQKYYLGELDGTSIKDKKVALPPCKMLEERHT